MDGDPAQGRGFYRAVGVWTGGVVHRAWSVDGDRPQGFGRDCVDGARPQGFGVWRGRPRAWGVDGARPQGLWGVDGDRPQGRGDAEVSSANPPKSFFWRNMGVSKNRGTLFCGPYNTDPTT